MAFYKVNVSWTSCGSYLIKADSVEQAIVKIKEMPLPTDEEYLSDSLSIDEIIEIGGSTNGRI